MNKDKDFVVDANTQKAIERYKKALIKAGYSGGTIDAYIGSVILYLRRGGKSDANDAEEYFEKFNLKNKATRASITKWVKFIQDGKPIQRTYQARPVRKYILDCNRDCFNCIYEDCLLPTGVLWHTNPLVKYTNRICTYGCEEIQKDKVQRGRQEKGKTAQAVRQEEQTMYQMPQAIRP